MQCIRNFYEWWSQCDSTKGERPHRWLRAEVIGSALTYWAAAGCDTPMQPLRVFIDTSFRRNTVAPVSPSLSAHRAWHQRQLLRVTR